MTNWQGFLQRLEPYRWAIIGIIGSILIGLYGVRKGLIHIAPYYEIPLIGALIVAFFTWNRDKNILNLIFRTTGMFYVNLSIVYVFVVAVLEQPLPEPLPMLQKIFLTVGLLMLFLIMLGYFTAETILSSWVYTVLEKFYNIAPATKIEPKKPE